MLLVHYAMASFVVTTPLLLGSLLFSKAFSYPYQAYPSSIGYSRQVSFLIPKPTTAASATSLLMGTSATITTEWSSLNPESLVSAPCLIEQTLCQSGDNQPQLAKDVDYARAIFDAWKEQEEADDERLWNAEWCSITYHPEGQDSPLYGHLIRNPDTVTKAVPGIVLFHTG